jgi:hypothetical protein
MNNSGTEIERWLIEGSVDHDQGLDSFMVGDFYMLINFRQDFCLLLSVL